MPTSAGNAGAKKAMPCRSAPIDLLAKHKLGLFGAITSKPKKQAEAELGLNFAARAIRISARSSRCGNVFTSIRAFARAFRFPAIR